MVATPQTSSHLIKQPEFRPVFYLLPLVIAVGVIGFIYLPFLWAWVVVGILLLIGALLIAMSWRLSLANVRIKTETSQMESIIAHLNMGVLAYDASFRVLIFNPAAEEIFGLSSKDVIGTTLSADLSSDPLRKLLIQVVFSTLAPTVVRRSDPGVYPQVLDISFDEPRLDLRVTTDRIFDNAGQVSGFVKLITNRTREIELLKSKTEFISVAAHQLRTPLTAINWAVESLVGSKNVDEQEKETLQTAFSAAKKMLKTVNDLLDVSKIEEGRFGYQFEVVDLASYLEEILADANDLAKQYGIKLYFQRPQQSVRVVIDKQKVSMVLYNLLDNAIKYNVEHGTVTVSAQMVQGKPFAKVSIVDTGIGIPSDQVAKLFTKFFRAENVTKVAPDGTGLGLYISRNVIRRHGGDIWAESEINRGSTFSFTLPTDTNVIPRRELTEFE